jgi:hypothetical protein
MLYADSNGQRNIRKQQRFWRHPIRISAGGVTILIKKIRDFPDIQRKRRNGTFKYVTSESSVIISSY